VPNGTQRFTRCEKTRSHRTDRYIEGGSQFTIGLTFNFTKPQERTMITAQQAKCFSNDGPRIEMAWSKADRVLTRSLAFAFCSIRPPVGAQFQRASHAMSHAQDRSRADGARCP